MYRFRFATKGDYDFLYKLMEITMKEYYIATYGGWDEEIERNFFNESFNNYKYQIIVFEDKDIGCLAVKKSDDSIFINEIQILPEFQGKGIGKNILDLIINDSERLRIPINLQVLKVNKRAQDFYTGAGFKNTGETETHLIMSRIPTTSV